MDNDHLDPVESGGDHITIIKDTAEVDPTTGDLVVVEDVEYIPATQPNPIDQPAPEKYEPYTGRHPGE